MNISELLKQSEIRHNQASEIISRLGLMEKWGQYGSPRLLGAVSMNLVWNRDIDMNIYAHAPDLKNGFAVMGEIAAIPGVNSIGFHNFINTPDQGYYWCVDYTGADGKQWKIDNWYVADNHPDAMVGENLSARINEIITDAQRSSIIKLKYLSRKEKGIRGIDIYRAVIEGGIEDISSLMEWIDEHRNNGMMYWMP